MSANFNLRGIQPELMAELKHQAVNEKISVNSLIIKLVNSGLGLTYERKRPIYHDLDQYAGTWSPEDETEFLQATSAFEMIDEDLWK